MPVKLTKEQEKYKREDSEDVLAWLDSLDTHQIHEQYTNVNSILEEIQNEIINRQHSSKSISCPPFLPVIQALINPTKETHRNSRSKSRSKHKSRASSVTPRTPSLSEYDADDSTSICSKTYSTSVKMDSSPSYFQANSPVVDLTHIPKSLSSLSATNSSIISSNNESQTICFQPFNSNQSIQVKQEPNEIQVDPTNSFLVDQNVAFEQILSTSMPVSAPPIYRYLIEVLVTVANQGIHTESELLSCCQQYMSHSEKYNKVNFMMIQSLLPLLCRLFIYLGILTPSTSYHLTSSYQFTHQSSSGIQYPSFLLPIKTEYNTNEKLNDYLQNGDMANWISNRSKDGINHAYEGIINNLPWLSDSSKKIVYNWIGIKSTEFGVPIESLVGTELSLQIGDVPFLSTSTSLNLKNGNSELPSYILDLLQSPSLSVQQLQQLDLNSQNILYSYIFNQPNYCHLIPSFHVEKQQNPKMTNSSMIHYSFNSAQFESILKDNIWNIIKQWNNLLQDQQRLEKREEDLWKKVLARYNLHISSGLTCTQQTTKSHIDSKQIKIKRSHHKEKTNEETTRLRLSRPLSYAEGDLYIYSSPISWAEVVDNFISVKKAKKSVLSPVTMPLMSSMNSPSSSTNEETKRVLTPRAEIVTRKRITWSREEKEKRLNNDIKRRKIEEENQYYLKINTDNLQMMKDRVEAIKLKMKEMKEKKSKKEKSKKKS